MGNYFQLYRMFDKVQKTKQLKILALGGSITAGGYFMEFKRLLNEKHGYNVTVENHGHGATELTCGLFVIRDYDLIINT